MKHANTIRSALTALTLGFGLGFATGCDTGPAHDAERLDEQLEQLEQPEEIERIEHEIVIVRGSDAVAAIAELKPEDLPSLQAQAAALDVALDDTPIAAAAFSEDDLETLLSEGPEAEGFDDCPAWRCINAYNYAHWDCHDQGGYVKNFYWNDYICIGYWQCGFFPQQH